MVIFIGLMEWSEEESNLKPKRGKRLVSRDAPYKVLIEKAVKKWKSYNSNLYEEGEDYVLLVDNGQEALFLPGPRKEFFSLWHYQFKRITLYLCLAREFIILKLLALIAMHQTLKMKIIQAINKELGFLQGENGPGSQKRGQ